MTESPSIHTREGSGRAAAGVGLLIGAHIGMVPGAVAGLLAYQVFATDTGGGGWGGLVGAFFGALVGLVVGGALGCLVGLRTRWYPHAGRTAITAAVLLTAGVAVFFAVWAIGADRDLSGWWYFLGLEGPVLITAVVVRRLTPVPD